MTDKVTYKWMESYDVVFGEDQEEGIKSEFGQLLDSEESRVFAREKFSKEKLSQLDKIM